MSSAASLIVFVAAGHLGDPAMSSLRGAIEQTLGASSRITIEVSDEVPSDADAELLSDMLGVTALGEVVWLEPPADIATVRVFARTRAAWVDRKVRFQVADEDAERGRTIGYALSALVPEPPEEAPAPSPVPSSAPVAHDLIAPTSRPASSRSAVSIDAFAALTRVSGIDLLGGGATLTASAPSGFGLHAEASARAGHFQAADVHILDLRVAIGPTRVWSFERIRTALTLSAVAMRETVTVARAERSRLIPAGALSLHVAWHAFGACWLGVSLGAEVVPGATEVFVGADRAVRMSPVRALGALTFGLRL